MGRKPAAESMGIQARVRRALLSHAVQTRGMSVDEIIGIGMGKSWFYEWSKNYNLYEVRRVGNKIYWRMGK